MRAARPSRAAALPSLDAVAAERPSPFRGGIGSLVAELKTDWMEELSELLRIRSISADPEHKDDVRRAAEWVAEAVRRMGGEAQLVETATFRRSSARCLRPGAAMLQPSSATGTSTCSPRGGARWGNRSFEPEGAGRLALRAPQVADDKGQLWALLKATEELAAAGELPVNVGSCATGRRRPAATRSSKISPPRTSAAPMRR